jgi:O-antigen ligase
MHSVPLILGGLFGIALYSIASLPSKWLVAVTALLLLLCVSGILGRVRPLLLFFLPLSIPVTFNYHIIYRPDHIGTSGLTIESIDLWLFPLAIMWLWGLRFGRQERIRPFSATTLPFLFVLVGGLLSFVNTNHLDLSFYGLVDLARCFLLYLCVANNTLDPGDRRIVLLGLQGSVFLVGVACVVEAIFQVNFTGSTYELYGMEEGGAVFRSAGLTTPTLTAGYLASMLPILCAQLFTSIGRVHRISLLSSMLIGGIGLIFTLTRGAFLCLAVGLLPLLYLLMRRKWLRLIHIVLVLGVLAIPVSVYHEEIKVRLGEGSDNVLARYGLVMTAWNVILENPLLGTGLNTYDQEMAKYATNSVQHSFEYVVHNNYLLLWAESGIFALLGFLALLCVSVWKAAFTCRLQDPEKSTIAAGLLASLIVASIHMNSEAYGAGSLMYMLSLQVALIASLFYSSSTPGKPDRPALSMRSQRGITKH